MNSEKFSLVVTIQAKEQAKERLKQTLLSMAVETHKEPGNITYDLHESLDDDSLFIIHETWIDQAALDGHMNQPYLKSFRAASDELLAREVESTRCKRISPCKK